ncbi:hypothetical protein CMO92_05055 [Candidatus Woesearchaeota archaeon]|nr:hypothetical protein [Candidatus Woesearchaeota archaeon]
MTPLCFFCDIHKEDDDQKIAENDHFYARFDDVPVNKGHAILFPKNHVESILDLAEEELAPMFCLVKQVKEKIGEKYEDIAGWNIGADEGEAAGEFFNHFHFHIIPRYKGEKKHEGIRSVLDANDYRETIKTRFKNRIKYVED